MTGPAKPNKTQVEMGRRWLNKARQLRGQGRWLEAITNARMSYRMLKSTAAIRIIGHCSCRVGGSFHARYARWAYGLLPRTDKGVMKTLCGRRQITLP